MRSKKMSAFLPSVAAACRCPALLTYLPTAVAHGLDGGGQQRQAHALHVALRAVFVCRRLCVRHLLTPAVPSGRLQWACNPLSGIKEFCVVNFSYTPSPHPKTTAPDFALSPSRYRASLLRRLSRGRATLRLPKIEGVQADKRVEMVKGEPLPPPPPPPSPGREEGCVLSPEGYEADDEAARVQITWMCDELSHLSGLTFHLHDSPPHNPWATGPTTLAHLPVPEAQPRILDLRTSSLETQQLYDPLYFHPRLLAPPIQASAFTGVNGVQEEEAGQGYAEEEDVSKEKSMRVHFNSKTWQHALSRMTWPRCARRQQKPTRWYPSSWRADRQSSLTWLSCARLV